MAIKPSKKKEKFMSELQTTYTQSQGINSWGGCLGLMALVVVLAFVMGA